MGGKLRDKSLEQRSIETCVATKDIKIYLLLVVELSKNKDFLTFNDYILCLIWFCFYEK